jgi:hypothetical protein
LFAKTLVSNYRISYYKKLQHQIGSTCIAILKPQFYHLFFVYGHIVTASVVQWLEFLATDPEARVRFPALPEKKVVVLERGPLSLVSTTEELLDRIVAAPV